MPAMVIMARSSTSADALIEILNLCEQTLTALEPDARANPNTPQADKAGDSKQLHGRQFVLIRGGLAKESGQSKSL